VQGEDHQRKEKQAAIPGGVVTVLLHAYNLDRTRHAVTATAARLASSTAPAASFAILILLIHGTHDDNVPPQNTTRLIDALIKKRKQFDLMIYPNETHSIPGTDEVIHLWTMVYEYMERNLR
jgi:predicted esterase